MAIQWFKNNDLPFLLALSPPLLVRFFGDGPDAATQRLALLVLAFGLAYAWSAVFERQIRRSPQGAQLHFAMLFVLFLPAPVGWVGAVLAVSFGWVFGREIFGGRAILPPALIALAFAIFSFPAGGYETLQILSAPPEPLLALACLPGAAWLLWKKAIAWPVVVGAALGVVLAAWLVGAPSSPPWWSHFALGTFSIGILFVAAAEECAPHTERACWLYGLLIGALIVSIRLANPEQPDGVALAVLLGGLFAPLLDRALSWKLRDA